MSTLLIIAFVSTSYTICLCIYRIWLHPLATIPGPSLAALTGWYETYFELLHKGLGGQYTFHIRELHDRYGPVVRISPWEVHVDDPAFYSTIYTSREGLDRPEYLRWRFGAPYALLSTPEHRLHRLRRAAQDPFFARGRIARLAPMMQQKAAKMCEALSRQGFVGSGRPLTLDDMFASFVADVTTQYGFDRDFDWLGHAGFASPFLGAIGGLKRIAHPCTQFPWLARLATTAVPEAVVRVLQPSMSVVAGFHEEMRELVRGAQRDLASSSSSSSPSKDRECDGAQREKTIVHGILRSGLPSEELEMERLKDHATALLAAGVASPAWTLRTAFYHILSDGAVYDRLKTELKSIMPCPTDVAPLDKMEKLPYLTACIEEALRLACCQMTRSPRISSKPVTYANYTLPPGTHVSLDTWHMHHNETLFPDSFSFRPDRWLGNPRAPAPYDSRPLRHYMTSFGRGTRNCIGITLSYAEMTIALAVLLRRFDWELYDTTYERDVKVVRDLMAPDVSGESKGIRALVKESNE